MTLLCQQAAIRPQSNNSTSVPTRKASPELACTELAVALNEAEGVVEVPKNWWF